MTIRASLLFAYRLLFPRTGRNSFARKSLVGALICIGISLIPLVVVLSVSDGMIKGITDRIIALSSAHIKVTLYPDIDEVSSAAALTAYARELAESDEDITAAYAEIDGMGLAAGKSGRTGASVRAIDPAVFSGKDSYSRLFTVTAGSMDLSSPRSAVIGRKISELLGISCGDTFRLITTRQTASGGVAPKITVFTVTGIVSCGYQELDALWVFVPLARGFEILPLQSSELSVRFETCNAFSPELVAVQRRLAARVGVNGRAVRWDELNQSEYENFASTKVMLLFIMLLIVLVASVNVCSALIMLSMERRREIAILKSIGGTGSGITLSFLITGLVTGIGGVITGIPLGLFLAVNINKIIDFIEKTVNFIAKIVYLFRYKDTVNFVAINLLDPAYYLQNIPVSLPWKDLFIISAGTLVLSLLASALPAVRAGREKPLDTLRKL